jgi:hypothetical protein
MEYVKRGFLVNYDVLELGLIKPGGHGEYNGTPYKASLKIKVQNIIQKEHEEMGLIDSEELLEFVIRCDTNIESTELGKMFRILKENGVVVHFNGSLPKYSENSEYLKVDVVDSPTDLMKKYHDLMKQKNVKSSNQ